MLQKSSLNFKFIFSSVIYVDEEKALARYCAGGIAAVFFFKDGLYVGTGELVRGDVEEGAGDVADHFVEKAGAGELKTVVIPPFIDEANWFKGFDRA